MAPSMSSPRALALSRAGQASFQWAWQVCIWFKLCIVNVGSLYENNERSDFYVSSLAWKEISLLRNLSPAGYIFFLIFSWLIIIYRACSLIVLNFAKWPWLYSQLEFLLWYIMNVMWTILLSLLLLHLTPSLQNTFNVGIVTHKGLLA